MSGKEAMFPLFRKGIKPSFPSSPVVVYHVNVEDVLSLNGARTLLGTYVQQLLGRLRWRGGGLTSQEWMESYNDSYQDKIDEAMFGLCVAVLLQAELIYKVTQSHGLACWFLDTPEES